MKNNPILNLILDTDSYKFSHFKQYPPGSTSVFSYVEARGVSDEIQELYDKFLPGETPKTTFFGAQYFIKEYLSKPVTHADIDQAKPIVEAHGFEFNEEGWRYIVNKYDGWLPVRIRSVREGSVVPVSNILSSIESTDPRCFWLVSYLETAWLRSNWYPTTVASNGYITKKILKRFMDETADYDPVELDFMMHDFGARGVSSKESAGVGGMAHLVYFQGTDTVTGALYAMEYYGRGDGQIDMPGFSIPASEHSTMTSWGKEGESKAFANMIHQFGGEGKIVACVSDSYDIYNAAENVWGRELKDLVEKNGARLVVRPDSGDPLVVPIDIIKILMERFGYTTNSKGYRVLPDFVRVIQGDGITITSMAKILENLKKEKLSASNIVFGRGAGTLQLVSRDDYKFAMKASAIEIGGTWKDVYKEPKTDSGKNSKRGRLTLVHDPELNRYRTIRTDEPVEYLEQNVMNTVYSNGPVESAFTSFINVRSEAAKALR